MTALTPVATGVAGGRETSVGLDVPASPAPVASLDELCAAADVAYKASNDAWRMFGDVCRLIARRSVMGVSLTDADREEWRTAEEAWESLNAVTKAAHAAWEAARYGDAPAVGEGNSPDGIVRPVEAGAL